MSQAPTPDSSWKGLPSWLLFGFLVLGPPTAFIAFARTVTQNPLLIALLIGGYEVLVFLLRFTGKIWLKLEDPLVDHLAGLIILRVQEFTSRYYRHYCQHLVYEHQIFDMKGLSTRTAHDLELEQIFVDLSIDPTATHHTSVDPFHVPASLQQGEHSIWEYLFSPSLANRHLVIIGAPGSGKTTLLKHLALTLAQPKKHLYRRQLTHTLPILLFLRDHVGNLRDKPDFSLVDAIQNHLQRKWHHTVPSEWFLRQLSKGRCMILLDGLDEVANALTRRQVADWVQRQILAYGQNRFLLSSRPYGYRDNPLEGVTVLEVHPFTAHQIERFVQNWYLANELKSWGKEDPGVHLRAREGAQDLLGRLLQAPALSALAVNPLLLTMITTVHRYRASLPGKRVALYAEICEVFLGKRQEARGIAQELSAAQKQQVLQPLAYHLMIKGEREIEASEAEQVIAPHVTVVSTQLPPADFLEMIQNTSGLLLERNPGLYGFAHLTFQEYLAAVHIKEENLEQVLVGQVSNSWWHETIRLYCAQADATVLIEACLTAKHPSLQALELALECQYEALKIQQSLRSHLDTLLTQGVEDPDEERRRVIAEALLARRLQQMVHLQKEIYFDTSLITCAEYQLFLDELVEQEVSYQPDHWKTRTFPTGTGSTPVLGVRWADAQAFCGWLTARNTDLWRYRMPTSTELSRIENDEETSIKLAAETGYWIEKGQCRISKLPFSREASSKKLQHILVRDLDRGRDLDLDRTFDIDLALDLDRILDLTSPIDNALTLDLDRVIDRASAIDLTIDHDLAHERELTLDRARDFALSLDLPRDLARARNRALDRAVDRALNHAIDRTQASTRTIETPLKNLQEERNLLLWYIRFSAYTLARYFRFLSHVAGSPGKRPLHLFPNKSEASSSSIFEQLVTSYLDIYFTFAFLEERIERRFPAWEGILLVKERVEDS